MTELTKGKYSTVRIRIEVKELLANYKQRYNMKSINEAVLDCLSLAYQYRKLAELVVKKEMTKHD